MGFAIILLTCCVGILAVVPYLSLMMVVIYLMITGQTTMRQSYAVPQQATANLQ